MHFNFVCKNRSSLCSIAHERSCPQNRGSGQGHAIPVLPPAHWAAQPQHKNQLQALTAQHLLTSWSLPSACGTARGETTKRLKLECLWCRQQGFWARGFSILRSGFLPASQHFFMWTAISLATKEGQGKELNVFNRAYIYIFCDVLQGDARESFNSSNTLPKEVQEILPFFLYLWERTKKKREEISGFILKDRIQ